MNDDDAELLHRYLERGSQTAFAELVRRHVGLVYAVVLRRVGGDLHLAEDVAQRVFGDFARKAARLRDLSSLSGWFYASAFRASAAAVRTERRRKAREAEAQLMETIDSAPSDPASDLNPFIDEAIQKLKDEEREAVLLRYFEKRSYAEVGNALRITEEAARKRVDRAIEKLRAGLARRGITSSAAAVALALAAAGSSSVPAGLADQLARQATASVVASTGGSFATILAGALWPAAVAVVVGGLSIGLQRQSNERLRTELRLLATQAHEVSMLREENLRLASIIPRLSSVPERIPAGPIERTAPAGRVVSVIPRTPRPVSAHVDLSADGRISWDGEPVRLDEFLVFLQASRRATDPESHLAIRGRNASFPALDYVIEEVRKNGVNHLTVESAAIPRPGLDRSWF